MEININQCQRGYVLKATDRSWDAGLHFIVFYDQLDGHDFIGAMLTHKESSKNASMDEHHFEAFAEDGNLYEFQYDHTKIVIAKLRKFGDWQPFSLVGKLSDSGISFVENLIEDLDLEDWDGYKERARHERD
jgi:hypothetical protein